MKGPYISVLLQGKWGKVMDLIGDYINEEEWLLMLKRESYNKPFPCHPKFHKCIRGDY